ncbi:MAG: preprotein translocase subunit SecY [bacterium]
MLERIISKFKEVFSSKEIRKRVFFTLFVIVAFRILASIPIPGINPQAFIEQFGGSPFTNIFRAVTGGSLDNPSIVAVALGPYISASIVIQLLQSVIKKLDDLSKEGQRGKMILNQYTRLLTVPITILQSLAIYATLKSKPDLLGDSSTLQIVTMLVAITAGTMLLMWLAELIAEHGIGNGPSIIISIGILSALPGLISSDIKKFTDNGQINILLIILLAFIVVIALIVFVNEAVRKVPIQYASRVRGNKTYSTPASFFPIKVTTAGVMPIIFASSLLLFPQIISQLITSTMNPGRFLYNVADWLTKYFYNKVNPEIIWKYELFYVVLIVAFTYFYTFVAFKPSDVAENLKKSGGFIPGIRPGGATAKYITGILIRVTLVGSLFLGFIAVLPNIPTILGTGITLALFTGIGGTSILIVVTVILDTLRQINSLVVTRSYEKYK